MYSAVLFISFCVIIGFVVRLALWAYCFFIRPLDLSCYKALEGTGESWALVTGGTGGIGKAFVETLLQQGFSVVFTGRSVEKLEAIHPELSQKYPDRKLAYIVSDATDTSKQNFENIVDCCQDKDIRILINNAGVSHGQWKLHYLEHDRILDCIRVNSEYPTLLTRYLLPLMGAGASQDSKRLVIFVSSFTCMLIANPFASVYAATKTYLRALSKSLTEEHADGSIRFLCANFGYVATKMSKLKKNMFATEPHEAVASCLRMHDQVDIIPHIKDFQWHFWNYVTPLFLIDKIPGGCLFFVAQYRVYLDKLRGKNQSCLKKQN